MLEKKCMKEEKKKKKWQRKKKPYTKWCVCFIACYWLYCVCHGSNKYVNVDNVRLKSGNKIE